MKKELFTTADGSPSLRVVSLRETYHSRHGAQTESEYVYIDKGLRFWLQENGQSKCQIFELGFGTGLNAYLTAAFAIQNKIEIEFHSVENNPLTLEEAIIFGKHIPKLEDCSNLDFHELHQCEWEQAVKMSPFILTKYQNDFKNQNIDRTYDVLYYDAFGAHAQPELWTPEWMQKCFEMLNPGGVWVSYCAKGSVRRGLEAAGFKTERLPGPPGKREMLRAIKP